MSYSLQPHELVACQAPLSMGFSRQEYWSGLLHPPPGDIPNPGIELSFPGSPALADGFFTTESPGKPMLLVSSLHLALGIKDFLLYFL